MKRIRISHSTEYRYRVPVTFGEHQAMLRPRKGHDVHIAGWQLDIEPEAEVEWVRDIYGNSIAHLTFSGPAAKLRIASEIEVDLFEADAIDCPIRSFGKLYPFQYAGNKQVEIMSHRIPSYPHDGPALVDWLREFYAVLMMESVRQWGFASRFVTGYIQMAEGQHGASHAWTEVYLPGAGWRGFDPTNNKLAGSEHISVAVARSQEKAMPVSGTWSGPADAFEGMGVVVEVAPV
jgi:transglutaminase-like putative cysteine protease